MVTSNEIIDRLVKSNTDKIMSKARILVIDFNTLKYDTFHMLLLKLFEEKSFMEFHAKFPEFAKLSIDEKIKLVHKNCTSRNPYDFIGINNNLSLADAYSEFLGSSARGSDNNFFRTGMYFGIDQASYLNPVEKIYILRDVDDEIFRTEYEKSNPKITAYMTSDFFNVDTILRFIEQFRINTIFIDSVCIALKIAEATKDKTIVFGNYAYNYNIEDNSNATVRVLKNAEEFANLEKSNGHEFATFNPFHFTGTLEVEIKEDTDKQ